MLLLLSLALAAPGTVLPLPPSVPPGRVAPLPDDLLRAAIDRRTQGDHDAAIWYYDHYLSSKKGDGRTRAGAMIALGRLYEEQGDYNYAAAWYSRARSSGTPVAPWATWHLARAEHLRGNHQTAANLCVSYQEKWPEGPHFQDCLVLMGDAYAAMGKRGAASAAYQKWLDTHPDSPLQETIRMRLALSASLGDPAGSIPLLQELLVSHQYHSTGITVQNRLNELKAQGFQTDLPSSDEWLCRLALERKRCGFDTEAWQSYQQIEAKAQQNPSLQAWLEQHEDDFMWGTRQYEALAADLASQMAARPDASLGWQRYRALAKAGLWNDAVEQLQSGMKTLGGRFSGAKIELARGLLLAGRYLEARDRWQAIGGREGRWLAAYAAFRAGELPDALSRLEAVIAGGGPEADSARYYRARTLEALGRKDEAEIQKGQILGSDPLSWYALLIRSEDPPPTGPLQARNGRWPGAPPAPPLSLAVVPPNTPTAGAISTGISVSSFSSTGKSVRSEEHTDSSVKIQWSGLAWKPTTALPLTAGGALPPASPPPSASLRPDSYQPIFLYDAAKAYVLLDTLGKEHPDLFPWAQGAADLGRGGAYDDAAPILAHMYQDVDLDKTNKYAALTLTIADWRQMCMLVRDDHNVARFTYGATKLATNDQQRLDALRANFPTAHVDAIFRQGQQWSVDPLLVLGLMRQESVYQQWALSPVGAIGLMQVMPRTGAKVAALMGDSHYSPSDLEDPSVNIRYGVYYLSRLLDRFGGAFPAAVGSYNGGPHNLSSWLRPFGDKIRMDDYVEQIPYPETRDYVRKVSGYYATYVALYGPPGAQVVVPAQIPSDQREVIDF